MRFKHEFLREVQPTKSTQIRYEGGLKGGADVECVSGIIFGRHTPEAEPVN